MNKIPPFRIDPLGSEKSEEGNLSKNGHHHQNSAPSSPAVDPVVVSSPKSKKRKLPMSDSNDSTNKSPKSSTPSPARDCHFLFECSLYFDIKFELFKTEQKMIIPVNQKRYQRHHQHHRTIQIMLTPRINRYLLY